MNAHHTFTSANIAQTAAQLADLEHIRLARAIVDRGAAALPYGHGGLYSLADWLSAAHWALDGDLSDIAHMLDREDAWEAFSDWQARDPRREYAEFEDWFANVWNRGRAAA